MTGNIDIILENKGSLTLRPSDHKATGGEGSIYKVGNFIIKIYLDPKKMLINDMIGKINILSKIQHEWIISPRGLVFDNNNRAIGYYMDFADGEPLSRFFTNTFRDEKHFRDKHSNILVDKIRQIFQFGHKNQAILGDPNELNFNVVFNHKDLYPLIMDVDSWNVNGKWPISAIMPSIRDWQTQETFNENSDWFSWGIVTFQVYTGIHPYKGTLSGYKIGDFTTRMKDNKSVFSPGISLNQAVRDFGCIPGRLLEWYKAEFQDGERSEPPSPFDTTIMAPKTAIVRKVVTNVSGMLIFDKLYSDSSEKIIKIYSCAGIGLTDNGKLIDLNKKQIIGLTFGKICEIINVENGWLIAELFTNKRLRLRYVKSNYEEIELDLNINAYELVRYENRLFVVTDQGLTEIKFKIFGKPIVSVGQTWSVMINSTEWFDGVGIQDSMGAMFLITPFGDNACNYIRVKELDGLKTIVAKAGYRFVSIIGIDKQGLYQKLELTFKEDYSSYQCWIGQTDDPDLNVAILPKGVCTTIINDGELVVFVPSNGKVNKINDKNISSKMKLGNLDNKVIYINDCGEVWSLGMK